ncbi:MAG: hypothetical protein ACOCTO_01605 [Marinilabiliaceae bacterium]
MDDIFGGIVYIVIMLAIFIFSAFRKKKEGDENVPAPEGGRENPMDEVFQPFKDVFSDEEEDEVSPEKQPAKTSSSRRGPQYSGRTDSHGEPFVKEDYVFTSETSPGDKRRQRKNQKPGQQTSLRSETDQPEKLHSGGPPEWFDLQKAVIFSEILKRPDY